MDLRMSSVCVCPSGPFSANGREDLIWAPASPPRTPHSPLQLLALRLNPSPPYPLPPVPSPPPPYPLLPPVPSPPPAPPPPPRDNLAAFSALGLTARFPEPCHPPPARGRGMRLRRGRRGPGPRLHPPAAGLRHAWPPVWPPLFKPYNHHCLPKYCHHFKLGPCHSFQG